MINFAVDKKFTRTYYDTQFSRCQDVWKYLVGFAVSINLVSDFFNRLARNSSRTSLLFGIIFPDGSPWSVFPFLDFAWFSLFDCFALVFPLFPFFSWSNFSFFHIFSKLFLKCKFFVKLLVDEATASIDDADRRFLSIDDSWDIDPRCCLDILAKNKKNANFMNSFGMAISPSQSSWHIIRKDCVGIVVYRVSAGVILGLLSVIERCFLKVSDKLLLKSDNNRNERYLDN